MSEYTILIADDHPLLRSAVVQSLRQSLPLAQVREAHQALEARKTTGCTILTL